MLLSHSLRCVPPITIPYFHFVKFLQSLLKIPKSGEIFAVLSLQIGCTLRGIILLLFLGMTIACVSETQLCVGTEAYIAHSISHYKPSKPWFHAVIPHGIHDKKFYLNSLRVHTKMEIRWQIKNSKIYQRKVWTVDRTRNMARIGVKTLCSADKGRKEACS